MWTVCQQPKMDGCDHSGGKFSLQKFENTSEVVLHNNYEQSLSKWSLTEDYLYKQLWGKFLYTKKNEFLEKEWK